MLYTNIRNEIKEAMKIKDTIKRDCLKMVVDKAKAIMKEKNPTDVSENIPDEVIVQAVQKEIKQLNQTCEALSGHESDKLYVDSKLKMAILSGYLPSQMTKEEVEKVVADILSNGEYSNFGLRMKAVMNELRGKADNKLIKEVVEAYK